MCTSNFQLILVVTTTITTHSLDQKFVSPPEELEKLIKDHFGDLVVSLSVSAKGSLFLSCWQQTSELTEASFFMEYLPMFYLIACVEDESKLSLKLISYHGIVIDSLSEDDQLMSSKEKLGFIKKHYLPHP